MALLLDRGKTTASIFLLLICAQMYSRMLTISGLPGPRAVGHHARRARPW